MIDSKGYIKVAGQRAHNKQQNTLRAKIFKRSISVFLFFTFLFFYYYYFLYFLCVQISVSPRRLVKVARGLCAVRPITSRPKLCPDKDTARRSIGGRWESSSLSQKHTRTHTHSLAHIRTRAQHDTDREQEEASNAIKLNLILSSFFFFLLLFWLIFSFPLSVCALTECWPVILPSTTRIPCASTLASCLVKFPSPCISPRLPWI